MDAFNGKRLVILGMARQGTALARFAVEAGAFVTFSDLRPEFKLRENLDDLADLPGDHLHYVLGDHPLSLLDQCDVLALSGGVAFDAPIVQEARRRGVPLTNDSLEFMRRNPAMMIGITGSAGKTTTTALVGSMGQKSGRPTWVGGNIGRPLITDLVHISSDDLVVQELSSFQLEVWGGEQAFAGLAIAAVLNITPNHLDRHKTMARYAEAKGNILRSQDSTGVAVLAADDPGAETLRHLARGRVRLFSRQMRVDDGAFVESDQIWLAANGETRPVCAVGDIRLRGAHNIANTLAAVAMAESAGLPDEAIVEGIKTFSGVPHRLEIVRKLDGVQYVNDSIATAPERALAALSAFDEPVILLAGGRDKDMVWEEWTRQVKHRAKHVVLFGELSEPLAERLMRNQEENDSLPITRVETMAEAVYVAYETARSGDVVLLSPGGTSFDDYNDFVERGEHFRLLVQDLE
ncbi:MAG: UDP-N-acetylmuramoyl-L-alanine--D-glutamate ligase [Chloroflexota bacterium]|jgi:UDP-N-acetylmuramoylalanine--D-glutamate ligase